MSHHVTPAHELPFYPRQEDDDYSNDCQQVTVTLPIHPSWKASAFPQLSTIRKGAPPKLMHANTKPT